MRRAVWIPLVALGITLAALILLLATGTLRAYAIPGSAMEPTLHCARPGAGCEADRKDRVLALTRFVSYGRGDLVVLAAPPRAVTGCGFGGRYVKRIVGLPRERLELRIVGGREHVYVDGERLAEPYVHETQRGSSRGRRVALADGQYYVLGDNRPHSCDSRVWGPLPGDYLRGKIVATYWPLDRITIR